jgi:WhiB family redox-sensing transcriptional regulator
MTKAPTAIRMAREGILHAEISHVPLPGFGEKAACLKSEPELFFSDRVSDIAAAKSICFSCPLIQNCARWAIRFEEFGVFGGLSAKERYLLRGAKPPLNPQEQEIAVQEVAYILGASAKEIAARYGVEARTVVRWRKLLNQIQEAI